MKFVLSVLLALASAPAFAVDVTVECFPKNYNCRAGCRWENYLSKTQETITLIKDPNYPNKDYPFNVLRGNFRAVVYDHTLNLDIIYREAKNLDPLSVHAILSAPNVAAETSGIHAIDISLRNANRGLGFDCSIN